MKTDPEAFSNLQIGTFSNCFGGLAQLARAFDWQSRGHGFDSHILHPENQRVTMLKHCNSFFSARILPEDG
jgi:hypothetical protein